MTKFNFFSLLILALFYNITNIFSQNEVISIDIKKYNYLKSESYKIKTTEINGNKRTKKDIILRELSIKEDEIIDKNIIISKVEEDKRKLIISGSYLLFPYARSIISNITMEGGFKPLVIQPIEFENMFQK